MIAITYTHRNGIELDESVTCLIDPEKICGVRTFNTYYAEIDYGETFDRRRQPIKYGLTTSVAAILATIKGNYDTLTHPYLALTVIDALKQKWKPDPDDNYTYNLQEKYIVDIRESYTMIGTTKTACRRIEFVPGSFIPVVLYVSDTLASLTDSTPAAVTTTTTTTTAAPTTTTTTPVATTTSTTPSGTTTTTPEGTTTTTTPTTPA